MDIGAVGVSERELPRALLASRPLQSYPGSGRRRWYLALIVVATIALYYQAYAPSAVTPQLFAQYGISLRFYFDVTGCGFLIGVATTLVGGLTDRFGRREMIVYGLMAVGVLVGLVQPHMPGKWSYAAVMTVVSLLEGMVVVATAALTRDFSPRMGRATAMGFWALGPVMGSLCATEVSSHTLSHLTAWQDQLEIAGITGLAVAAVVFVGLRELAPDVRNRVIASAAEAAVVEARRPVGSAARAPLHPWRQMATLRIVVSALAVSVFLLFYYGMVGLFVLYAETTFGYSGARANGLANWFWLANAAGLVIVGMASDRLRARTPFMVAGAIGSIVLTILFASRATDAHAGYSTLAVILAGLALCTGMVYGPWAAAFTETAEDRNPALVATGLALWNAILRVVVAAMAFFAPLVVTAVTPLVEYGPTVAQLDARYPDQAVTVAVVDPTTLAAITSGRDVAGPVLTLALAEIEKGRHLRAAGATADLEALRRMPPAQLGYLVSHQSTVARAGVANPRQWQHWWWITVAGQVVFVLLIPWIGRRGLGRRARGGALRPRAS